MVVAKVSEDGEVGASAATDITLEDMVATCTESAAGWFCLLPLK